METLDSDAALDRHRGSEPIPGRLEDLLLARIARSRRPETSAVLSRSLRSFAPLSWDDTRWHRVIDDALGKLRNGGGSSADALKRADGGRPLGIPSATKWKRVCTHVLPALALRIPASESRVHRRLKEHDDWAAAVVARTHGLWQDGAPPTATATCDALVWRTLGLGGRPKKTPPEIRSYFLGQSADERGIKPERLLRRLAAQAVGAVRPDLTGLREALVRRWLAGVELDATTEDATERPEKARSGHRPPDLAQFAEVVQRGAARATRGTFGPRKVFIAPLWRELRANPLVGGLSLEEFKRQLVQANRAGLLVLARADLVAAMDPRDVAESETRHLEARFHFVEREGGAS